MLIYIDSDAVRMRVHRKLLVQSFPRLRVRCFERWESGILSGIPSDRVVYLFTCLDGMTESTMSTIVSAARAEHPGLRWFALWAQDHAVPDWVEGLVPESVLGLPMDVHAIKHHLIHRAT